MGLHQEFGQDASAPPDLDGQSASWGLKRCQMAGIPPLVHPGAIHDSTNTPDEAFDLLNRHIMLKLTYIFHSCFTLETDLCVLVFDYWMDRQGALRSILERSRHKHVYVFASHFHGDHFNRHIFEWRHICPNITFILSKDILKRRRAQQADADVWMVKGSTWEDSHLHAMATGSNDSGVSWIVELEGRRIFHAGDLCNWYARFLSEEKVPETIISDEFGEINPRAEEKRFLGELKDIRKIADKFDLVMFPVDGRIGNGYTLGARQFIERFQVGLFVPMHFVMSGFQSAWRMAPFCQEKQISFWSIDKEGASIAIIRDLIIRRTLHKDISRLKAIFTLARNFMAATGNPNQWAPDYPGEELLRQDVESGDSYVVERRGEIVATFVLRGGIDPTYATIYEGAWLNDLPYATIHRIASSGQAKGMLHLAMQFALQQYDNIRIDTHADNRVMQNAIHKEGFKYCGIIHCSDSRSKQEQTAPCSNYALPEGGKPKDSRSERLAYQFSNI